MVAGAAGVRRGGGAPAARTESAPGKKGRAPFTSVAAPACVGKCVLGRGGPHRPRGNVTDTVSAVHNVPRERPRISTRYSLARSLGTRPLCRRRVACGAWGGGPVSRRRSASFWSPTGEETGDGSRDVGSALGPRRTSVCGRRGLRAGSLGHAASRWGERQEWEAPRKFGARKAHRGSSHVGEGPRGATGGIEGARGQSKDRGRGSGGRGVRQMPFRRQQSHPEVTRLARLETLGRPLLSAGFQRRRVRSHTPSLCDSSVRDA